MVRRISLLGSKNSFIIVILFLLFVVEIYAFPKQLVFELADRERFCFFEEILDEGKYLFNYRVLRGGKKDIGVEILSPSKSRIFFQDRSHFGSTNFTTVKGVYSFCFNNEFSTFSDKRIFFQLRSEKILSLEEEAGGKKLPTAESLLDSSLSSIHEVMSQGKYYQIEYRTKETEGRLISEQLNSRVLFWSIAVTLVIIISTFGQVAILKNFFAEERPYNAFLREGRR